MTAAAARAQTTVPPRDDYVFHVYVDPIFGDDAQASALNPGVPGRPVPLSTHPGTANEIGGLLHHAPYAFKTLNTHTGAGGVFSAIHYINSVFPQSTYPWPGPHDKFVVQIVVHCLPGLYGPGTDLEPEVGLAYNGETFPIEIPHHVSLQGTSALDTIFDARLQHTAIVEILANLTSDAYADVMIDGLTFRRARSDGGPADPTNHTGAAIYIGGEGPLACTISNCVFTDNTVGIALDADEDENFLLAPRIVNNTFAWNLVGLWSGNNTPSQPNAGFARPVLLNNVFDSGDPGAPLGSPAAGFVGVHPFDLIVQSWTIGTAVNPIGLPFCAWEPARVNNGYSPAANWPSPAVRGTMPPPLPAPTVDITPFTNAGSLTTPRGTLYVNDVFRNAQVTTPADHSPHDFRLAPLTNVPPPSDPTGTPNPLVNVGIVMTGSVSAITMANGQIVTAPPGIPAASAEATMHAWDDDCEGFANSRVVARTGFPPGAYGGIDLGADEMGELIMAGYVDRTRIFSPARDIGGMSIAEHSRVFFLNDDSTAAYPRPEANWVEGQDFDWWLHVQTAPDAVGSGNNYTQGKSGSWRYAMVLAALGENFMRNLECDFSPTLLTDLHPWAGQFSAAYPGTTADIYAANPWFAHTVQTHGDDNPFLYHNPPPGYPASLNWNANTHITTSGILNPPGTFPFAGYVLSPAYGTAPFGPFGTCTGTTYSVNAAWGLGSDDPGCPDVLPTLTDPNRNLDWHGFRFNCQVDGSPSGPLPTSNLQTFLWVNHGPAPGGGTMSLSQMPSGESAATLTKVLPLVTTDWLERR